MIKGNIANVIIQDLSAHTHKPDCYGINSGLISDVVEGWHNKVYVIPHKAVSLPRSQSSEYPFM